MKKTVKPQGQTKKPVQARADLSIQDPNLTSQEAIIDNKGFIPVETENFDEPLANDIPAINDDQQDSPQGNPDTREMMDTIRQQNETIASMKVEHDAMMARINDTLAPKLEPGKHTTWSYRYATLPSEEYGD